MSISNYSELTTAVANWLGRDDLTNRIPEFIKGGEVRIQDDLRIPAFLTKTSSILYEGTSSITVGNDWLEMAAPPILSNYTEELSMTALRTTVTSTSTAPDGDSDASKALETSDTGTHIIVKTASAGTDSLRCSVYVKGIDRTGVRLMLTNTTDGVIGDVYYDLSTEEIHNTVAGSGTIKFVGNGWYKCTLEGTATVSSNTFTILICDDTWATSYTGDITKGIYYWEPIFEELPSFSKQLMVAKSYENVYGNLDKSSSGKPTTVALLNGTLYFDRVADNSYTVHYLKQTKSFLDGSTTTTNWLTDNYPMILLYAALLEASPYIEESTLNTYMPLYNEQVRRIQRHINRTRFTNWSQPHMRVGLK